MAPFVTLQPEVTDNIKMESSLKHQHLISIIDVLAHSQARLRGLNMDRSPQSVIENSYCGEGESQGGNVCTYTKGPTLL